MFKFDRKTKQFIGLLQNHDPEQSHSIRTIFEDSHSTIWAGTNNGLLKVNPDGATFQFILPNSNPQNPFNKTIKHILEEEDGSFLLATSGGLLQWNQTSHEVTENFLPAAFKDLQIDHFKFELIFQLLPP